MPFEAFLAETHARPSRAARFGFLASIAMHGPPITLFVTTWLTHAMLIGSHGLHLEAQQRRGTFFIPISLYGQGAGGGGDPASPVVANGGSQPRAGLLGRSGRAGRRGLLAPREIKRFPAKTEWSDPFMLGSYAAPSARGSIGSDAGHGDGHGGDGAGSGLSGHGTGGGPVSGGVGNGMIAATMVDRAKEKTSEKKLAAGEGQNRGRECGAAGADDYQIGADIELIIDDGRFMKAAYISQDSAAYYRTDEYYPRLYHEVYWPPGKREWTMLFRICVSTEGGVSTVAVLQSANDEVDRVVSTALQSWRYRPRMVDGGARPFCHPIRIIYSRPGMGR
jgi:hypothetical protein